MARLCLMGQPSKRVGFHVMCFSLRTSPWFPENVSQKGAGRLIQPHCPPVKDALCSVLKPTGICVARHLDTRFPTMIDRGKLPFQEDGRLPTLSVMGKETRSTIGAVAGPSPIPRKDLKALLAAL